MGKIKSKVFIGSSRESMKYVNAIQEGLSFAAIVTPWYAGVFGAMQYTMESLEDQLGQSDFAVFVFSPDDVATIRGKVNYITRDNTLFEMGLFWGRLGRERVFFIVPRTIVEVEEGLAEGFHLPSDLEGLTVLKYDSIEDRGDNNYRAAVSTACEHIKSVIEQQGCYQEPRKLLAEAREHAEKDYALIRLLRTLSKRLLEDPRKKYDYLYEAIRNTYQAPQSYHVEGIGVWRAENDGLRQIAGNEGQGKFYNFDVNQNREEDKKIIVVESFLNSVDLVLLKNDTSFDNTYVLCYPIENLLVLTVAITGRQKLSEEDFDQIFIDNHNLLDTINHLYGGTQHG